MLSGMSVVINGQRLRVYNAHLVGDNSIADRPLATPENSWRQLREMSARVTNNGVWYPSVVLGDFNVHPPSSYYTSVKSQLNYLGLLWVGFRDLWAEWAPAHNNPFEFTAPKLGRRLDYVVTRDWRVNAYGMLVQDTGTASDHRPMIADISF